MSRRQVNPARRITEGGIFTFSGSFPSNPRPPPLVSIGLVLLGMFLIIFYSYSSSGGSGIEKEAVIKVEGGISCTLEVKRALPILKKAYGDRMRTILHVGPDSCSVVSNLVKEENTEAWGVEPYDLDDADVNCKSYVRKGIVRVADIKFPLPYRTKSFSHVIVSDALDYLSPKYLNRTLLELARVSADSFVVFSAWGVEPYDLDDADVNCKSYVCKGIVRVADIKFPLPYRTKSFSHVIVSDSLDYLSPKYLNRTLLELARVSADSFVVFSGYPGQQRDKAAEVAKFGRPAKLRSQSWWIRFFVQSSLEENEAATKKFEQISVRRSYKSACQVFHLKPLG